MSGKTSGKILYLLKTEPELAARKIGRRSRQDLLEEKRAPYGEEIFSSLRGQLGWTPIEDMRLTLDQAKTRVEQLIEEAVER